MMRDWQSGATYKARRATTAQGKRDCRRGVNDPIRAQYKISQRSAGVAVLMLKNVIEGSFVEDRNKLEKNGYM